MTAGATSPEPATSAAPTASARGDPDPDVVSTTRLTFRPHTASKAHVPRPGPRTLLWIHCRHTHANRRTVARVRAVPDVRGDEFRPVSVSRSPERRAAASSIGPHSYRDSRIHPTHGQWPLR